MDTTLLNTKEPELVSSIVAASVNEDISTQNDTVSEEEEQNHDEAPPAIVIAEQNKQTKAQLEQIKNLIKCEKDDSKSSSRSNANHAQNSNMAALNYNDLIVALWNMVDTNGNNANNTNANNNNTPNSCHSLTSNTTDAASTSLHLLHSTQQQSDVNSNNKRRKEECEEDIDISSASICCIPSRSPPMHAHSSLSITNPSYLKRGKLKVVTNTNSKKTPHASVLKYCPNYLAYDARARKESKERISSHLKERQKLVLKCIELAIAEIDALGLDFSAQRAQYARFEDTNDILKDALDHLASQIDSWDGVQIKQCKKEAEDGTPIVIDTWQKFAKKAKNHQDQTSWKISGDYFFAPYIARVNRYIDGYCHCLVNVSCGFRCEIIKLGSLSFAVNLLNGKIKFHRTKLKPLIRHRTLVKSSGIHIEFENLSSKLTIRKFIQNAKAKRKENDGKSNIIAGDFYDELIKYVQNEYETQRKLVNDLVRHYKLHPGTQQPLPQPAKPPPPPPPLPMIPSLGAAHAHVVPVPVAVPPLPRVHLHHHHSIPPPIAHAHAPYNIPSIAIPQCISNENNNLNRNLNVNQLQHNRKRKRENSKAVSGTGTTPDICMIANKRRKTSETNHVKLETRMQLQYSIDFEYILSACNGSCGNKLGEFIAHIVAPNNENNNNLSSQQQLNVLSLKFGVFGNKMRDLFVSLVAANKSGAKKYENELLIALQNENLYISNRLCRDEAWIARFIDAFSVLLRRQETTSIVRRIADESCQRLSGDALELLEEVQRNGININQNDLYHKLDGIKRTNQYYRKMKLHAYATPLTNNELMAISIFIDNLNVIYINEWCKNGNGCKWKQLFNHLCAAIHKIYTAFVYKNDKYNCEFPIKLYHQTPLSCHFNIITILYAQQQQQNPNPPHTQTKFNVQNQLYNGQFIAAPIDWIIKPQPQLQINNNNNSQILNFKENVQWISLPAML